MNISERCLDKCGDLYSYKSPIAKIDNRQKKRTGSKIWESEYKKIYKS